MATLGECINKLSMSLSIRGADGSEVPMEVRPAVDKVSSVKRAIMHEPVLTGMVIELLPTGSTITMRNGDLLADYNLAAGVSMIVSARKIDFHLLWEFDSQRWTDATGNWNVLAFGESRASEDGSLLCRQQSLDQLMINKPGLPCSPTFQGIEVEETGWSCSFFTRAPHNSDNGSYYCRTLLGSRPDIAHILMNNLRIGKWGGGERHVEVDFDMSSLPEGWHHVCVVADATTKMQEFFVDGKSLGSLRAILAPIYKIGNSSDDEQPWACPICDFQLSFGP